MKVERLLMALFAMVFITISALAEIKSGSCGDNAKWILDTESGLLKIEGTGAMNKYSYYSSPFYSNSSYINKVEIADGITSIGDFAFYSCSNLSSVAIPNSVIGIGEQAFHLCNGLTAVHIYDLAAWCKISFLDTNNNPLKYAHNLYLNGKLVTDLTIPNTVTSIAPYAFYGCTCLTSVTIPNSVTSIGNMAFWDCTNVKELIYAEGCTTALNTGLNCITSVNLPNSVTYIESSAFSGCDKLTSVTIPNSVTSIGKQAFGASGLTSVVIPNSVTSIGDGAFGSCFHLTSVTIPNSITNIGAFVFESCTKLPSVTIPNSVTNIGRRAFWNCTGLTSLTIPNSVVSIEEYAFDSCTGMTSITLSNNLSNIGPSAFSGCYNLQTITLLNPVPPTCTGISTFECSNLRNKYDVYTYATLHVPMGSKEVYSSAHEWRYFPKIKEDMEIGGKVYYASLKVKQGTMGYTEQPVKADEKYTIYIGSLGESAINSITFNGRDVTNEVVNGYYTTPEIKASSELSISYEISDPDVVKSVELSNVRVMGYEGEVTISGVETESDVFVYDTTGKMVASESRVKGEVRLSIPENQLYIVKVGQRSYKVAM